MLSAYVKIPFQAVILLMGVLVFAFYLFARPPMLFNPVYQSRVESSARAGEYRQLELRFDETHAARRQAALDLEAARVAGDPAHMAAARAAFTEAERRLKSTRAEARTLVREVTGDAIYDDVNYVFPTFVTTHLPVGLVGLIIAAIFAAAMSSIAGEVNALATTTVIDVYKRHVRRQADDAHYLVVSKLATGFWGLVACAFAVYAARAGSLIEVVNKTGSFFYGTLLGAFALAIGTKQANGTGAFVGMLAGFATVIWAARYTSISYLWYNVIGAIVVVMVGLVVSRATRVRPGAGRLHP
jgi:Na+(H+)/acetate symporter ActP